MTNPTQHKNPAETLELQLDNLTEIVKGQQEQIKILNAQNEKLSVLIGMADALPDDDGVLNVKIENVNMPFMALVGFLVKFSLASIPAALVMGVITSLFIVLFGGFFYALFLSLINI